MLSHIYSDTTPSIQYTLLNESPLFSFSCISNCMIKSRDVNLVVMTDLLMYYSPMVCTANVHYQHVLIDFKGMKPVTWKTDITCDTVILIQLGASPNDMFFFIHNVLMRQMGDFFYEKCSRVSILIVFIGCYTCTFKEVKSMMTLSNNSLWNRCYLMPIMWSLGVIYYHQFSSQ